jgi:anaerobic magnesium-protoporphyrin IX monomethyl ester cyclase
MPPSVTSRHGYTHVKCSYAGLGLVQVAGYLHKHGYESQILDFSNWNPSNQPDACDIDGFDIYGITMYTESALGVDILGRKIREANPTARIIIGGHHASHNWESVLSEYPYIYAVIVGHGEIPMKNLVDGIADGSCSRDYPGVAYKTPSGECIFHGQYVSRNLDEIEVDLGWLKAEYVCFPLVEYAKRLFPQHPKLFRSYLERNRYRDGRRAAGIMTTRGCHGRCSFCTFEISVGYQKHRIGYVVDLLDWCASRGISNLVFYDSTFLADLGHVEAMCRAMIRNKYDFRWTAQTHVHHQDRSIIKLMAEAGLVQMNLGLESGSPTILRNMNKRLDMDEFPGVVEAYREAGVGVCANLIIGSPGEDDETVRDTCRLFYRVDAEAIGEVQDLRLYPGSRWHFRAIEEGRLSKEWDWKEKGVPRFIFHNEPEIKRWQVMMEAHLRYASVFSQIQRPIDTIALVGFQADANTSFLLEALGFAFPACPIGESVVPGKANLIIAFCAECPEFAHVACKKDQLVWCYQEGNTFKLKIID